MGVLLKTGQIGFENKRRNAGTNEEWISERLQEPILLVRGILFGGSLQLFHVENVLLPATCKFVADEVIFGNHVDFDCAGSKRR